jgi:YidB-like protein/Ion channel
MAVSGDQFHQAFGGSALGEIASQLGMSQHQASSTMAQILPELINQLTPNGRIPDNAGDLDFSRTVDVAWAFAYIYVVCQALLPGGFGFHAASGMPRTWMELIFLSLTTLSGVGLGDIVPLLPMARALVMIEEFSGVMYLALVVSRLVALSVTTRTAR